MSRAITDTALLIGLSPEGKCVYSESLKLSDYWEELHVWDDDEAVKKLRLERLKGFLFDDDGDLFQEFESTFDLTTGIYLKGWVRHSDGTFREDKA